MDNAILLASGKFYSYTNPEQNDYTIEDVALSLSHICRFGGQLPQFYSVAQHAVYVSYAVPPEFALAGLLHDNVEAFMGDIPTPLKRMLPDYKAMEKLHEEVMCKKFGIPFPMPKEVHKADIEVFAAEVLALQPTGTHWACLEGVTPFSGHDCPLSSIDEGKIVPMTSAGARYMFLDRYKQLTGGK